jgi:hypothetical protein
MGLLATAKGSKDESKDKKKASKEKGSKVHPAADTYRAPKKATPSDEIAKNAPGAATAQSASEGTSQAGPSDSTDEGDSSGDSQPGGDQEGADAESSEESDAPDAGADDGQSGGDGESGGTVDEPSDPQNQGGDDSDDSQSQGGAPGEDGDVQQRGDAQGGSPSGSGNEVPLDKIPIPPALREEYQRANAALYTALYTNDKVAQAVLKGIVPQGPHKIESIARMATLLVTQINKKLHFVQDAPAMVMAFTQDCVTHVLDLAEQVKKIQFSEQEAVAALGCAQEIIMRVCGVTKKQMAALRQHIPKSQMQAGAEKYRAALAFTHGARPSDPNTANGPPPASGSSRGRVPGGPNGPGGGPSPGGPSPGAGPGAQGGPGGQPQPGAPVTAAPGPGQSAPPGGMLSAAQPPQGGQ